MSSNKGIIFLSIVAIAAIGMSGASIFLLNTNTQNNDDGILVVGLWEDCERNMDYFPYTNSYNWLIQFSDKIIQNTQYVSMSNSDTNITLLKTGMYRITLTMLLEGIVSSNSYEVNMKMNGATSHYFFQFQSDPDTNNNFVFFSTSVFINISVPVSLIFNTNDFFGYSFSPGGATRNQFSIEYYQ